MKAVSVEKKYSGMRIEKYIPCVFPNLPASVMFRAFRKKDIKVNGTRTRQDYILNAGDYVEIYIADNYFESTGQNETNIKSFFDVVYEDNNLIIVNKAQGIAVHPDSNNDPISLISEVQSYFLEKGEKFTEFKPSLCHRIDRNTGGLVIIAKNRASLDAIIQKLQRNEIRKYYLCIVKGVLDDKQKELKAYLVKDSRHSRVFISPEPSVSSFEILTKYKVLSEFNDMSMLEVEIITGRTHQIRAHLAYLGHPIAGDGKYGDNSFNRSIKAKHQALWAYKLTFNKTHRGGPLSYLDGKTFEVQPDFKIGFVMPPLK